MDDSGRYVNHWNLHSTAKWKTRAERNTSVCPKKAKLIEELYERYEISGDNRMPITRNSLHTGRGRAIFSRCKVTKSNPGNIS